MYDSLSGTGEKRLLRQNQKVNGQDRAVPLHTAVLNNSRRATDGIQPHALESSLDQQDKPHALHVSGIRTARNGTVQGVKEVGKKRKPRCNGGDRAKQWRYPTRKGADFLLVFLGHEH
jgi:hypothetical protein